MPALLDAVMSMNTALRSLGTKISQRWLIRYDKPGCPEGSPEEDWSHAAQELRARGEGPQKSCSLKRLTRVMPVYLENCRANAPYCRGGVRQATGDRTATLLLGMVSW
jgi:Protein of unknown function (DUF2934)